MSLNLKQKSRVGLPPSGITKRVALAGFAGAFLLVAHGADASPKRGVALQSNANKAQCVAALDEGQSLQSSRRLKDARARYMACAAETCPGVVREDCSKLLNDVEAALPSIVLSAKVDGHDVTDAKMLLDGQAPEGAEEGRSIVVDPGAHVARFERMGSAPIEVRIVAKEGEKNRQVVGSFIIPRIATTQPVNITSEKRGLPILPIALAGTGALAIGGSFLLRADANSRAEDLQARCAPACDAAERDSLSDRLVLANVGLAVGLTALAASAVTWILDSKR
jgi:hypothetical protein